MVAAPRRSCKDNLQTVALVFCRRAAPFKGISIFNAAWEEAELFVTEVRESFNRCDKNHSNPPQP
jgi:hypothetical protein